MANNREMSENEENSGGLGELRTNLAAGTTHVKSDLNMISRAIREGWNIPPEKRSIVVDRLLGLVQKTTVEVMTKNGIADLDGPADSNAIKAAAVLVSMSSEQQRDIHAEDKNNRLDSGKLTERSAIDAVVLERPISNPE